VRAERRAVEWLVDNSLVDGDGEARGGVRSRARHQQQPAVPSLPADGAADRRER
jgi:hypothetical protein